MAWGSKIQNVGASCMNCTDRYPGCHDQCEKYKEAVATEKARRQKISDMRKVEAQYLGYKSEKRRFNKI